MTGNELMWELARLTPAELALKVRLTNESPTPAFQAEHVVGIAVYGTESKDQYLNIVGMNQ